MLGLFFGAQTLPLSQCRSKLAGAPKVLACLVRDGQALSRRLEPSSSAELLIALKLVRHSHPYLAKWKLSR
jgi:hypothetical protein